jgi:uncharacterized protein (DUF488 family)
VSVQEKDNGTIYTIGHSTRAVDELVALLREAGVDLLIDIRTVPRSRFNPQFNNDTLPAALGAQGLHYRHLAALGGLRHAPKGAPPSPNGLWQNEAFRAYADYALTEPFRQGLAELHRFGDALTCAIMCAEAVWWRCHRRIVSDYLLSAGVEVRHILGPGKIEPASLTPGAEPQPDGTILYPPRQPALL